MFIILFCVRWILKKNNLSTEIKIIIIRKIIMNYSTEKEGNIFFIPLFLPNDIKNNIKVIQKQIFFLHKITALED